MSRKLFKIILTATVSVILIPGFLCFAQETYDPAKLSVKFEELTAPEFIRGVELSGGICIIPMGILEKHGPHLPLGTDLIDVREVVMRAVKKEYGIVFPPFYFGQIYEAKQQPGTIAYSPELVWKILQETCEELARNGIKKIILVNGHGGNTSFISYFCQAQLESPKDYVVVFFRPETDPDVARKVRELRKTTTGGHADETETSMIMAHRPELAHTELGKDQSGEDLKRLDHLSYGYTGIWWYAKYPNHYAGDGSEANPEIGNLVINHQADQLAELIRILKKDNTAIELQNQFFKQLIDPLNTKQ